LVVTETCKPIEPLCSETSQEFRSPTRHFWATHEKCFGSNQCARHSLLQNDRPFCRKSRVLSLRQISDERRRIALLDYISTRDHYRIVKLTYDGTSFCPWRAFPAQIGIHVGNLRPVGDVGEQAPDPATGKLCRHGIGIGRHRLCCCLLGTAFSSCNERLGVKRPVWR
jgi:hypothetical protein